MSKKKTILRTNADSVDNDSLLLEVDKAKKGQNKAEKKLKKLKKKMKKIKKKDKYSWRDDYDWCDDYSYLSGSCDSSLSTQCSQALVEQYHANQLLDVHAPGFFFGLRHQGSTDKYVGIPFGSEGHVAVIGGEGSGKSAGIIKPTLRTWGGAICATDIKGELSGFYAELYEQGVVTRPFIVFDPMQQDGTGYDPFAFLAQDGENNLISNMTELVQTLIPLPPEERQPFWIESERAILTEGLLYYFRKGLGFSDAILKISEQSVTELCRKMLDEESTELKVLLGGICDLKDETMASVDRGLRNKIMLFALDPFISNAFRGKNEDSNCFSWDDLDTYNVFLRIPEGRLEQWSGAIRLMVTQLIHHLERRPDKHSDGGESTVQTLLLLDEFARFGKMEAITGALATLRSKCVNICLVPQSLAQLGKFYGADDRSVILDNCRCMAILRADDPDTQEMLSKRIGTHLTLQRSASEHMNDDRDTTGYSRGISEIREFIVHPHELAYLEDILVLGFGGLTRVEKYLIHENRIPQWNKRPVPCINARILSDEEVAELEATGVVCVKATSAQIINEEE